MTVEKMLKILSEEYGIETKEEMDKALEKFTGVDIGIFTERSKNE